MILALLSLPYFSKHWFGNIIGLPTELTKIGVTNLWIVIPIPLLTFLQSYYQGLAVNAHKTRMITESVAVYAIVMVVIIAIGVAMQPENGITAVMIATAIGNLAQTLWLRFRCSQEQLEQASDASILTST